LEEASPTKQFPFTTSKIGQSALKTENDEQVFLSFFRDPNRVSKISNRVPRIRENYHRVPNIRENRVPRIGETGSLQVHTGYLTFSLKKTWCRENNQERL